jgi:hypothetical protein
MDFSNKWYLSGLILSVLHVLLGKITDHYSRGIIDETYSFHSGRQSLALRVL